MSGFIATVGTVFDFISSQELIVLNRHRSDFKIIDQRVSEREMSAESTVENPNIPLDSVVLVIGVNGLIASHAADQLLAAGYRVRGTVRNAEKNSYWIPLFDKRHGEGRFELVEVPDLTVPGAWDTVMVDVAGVAHCVGPMEIFVNDVEAQVKKDMPQLISALEAAKKQHTVKAFVLTSSAWAAWTPKAGKKVTLTENSWNREAIETAASTTLTPQEKGWSGFMAVKTRVEQEAWAWVDKEAPAYTFNTLLIDTVIGPCLAPKDQGIPSTAGFLKGLFYGQGADMLSGMAPQWYIDTRDTGKLFVAALVTPGLDRERLYGFGGRYSWYQIVEIFKQLHPDKPFPILPDLGVDQTEVPNYRAEQFLRGLGTWSGWVSLEDSVKDNVDSFLE
jgi:nucleoside-diphosphate-sugar epimerase